MCMVDDADRVNILSNVDRVARKEHRCGECGRMIQRGETYKVEAGVIDGRMEVYKTCAHCEEAESKLAAATRERDEATARLNAIIPSCEDWEARERDAERWRFIQSRAWVQMGAGYCEYSTFEASEKNRAFRGSEIDAAIEQRRAAASAGESRDGM